MTETSKGLGVAATRGVLWTGAGQLVKQASQIATSVILARLLVPEDFGLLGMALVFVGVAQMLADFGIGSAIVQGRSIEPKALSSAFWANVAVAGTLSLGIALASPWIAAFYDTPAIAPVVAVASLTLLLAGIQVVPQAILFRDMRFGDFAMANVVGSIAGSVLAIVMAWRGMGVWSLVAQPIFGSTITVALLFHLSRWLPKSQFSFDSIHDLVRFSGGIFGANMVNYVQRNTDSLLIGKFLGSGPLGYYQMAYQLMLFPLQQVSGIIVRVLFPTLSRLQDDIPRLRAGYLKAISGIGLVVFPMMMGLFAVAEDFIRLVLDEKWLPMLPVLQILSWTGMIQSIVTTVGTIYMSTGKPRLLFLVSLGGTPLLLVALAVGLRWGIVGVAAGYAIATVLLCYINLGFAFRLIGLSLLDFHKALWRPFACSALMLVAVVCISTTVSELPLAMRFMVQVGAGCICYIFFSYLFNRRQIVDLFEMLKVAAGKA